MGCEDFFYVRPLVWGTRKIVKCIKYLTLIYPHILSQQGDPYRSPLGPQCGFILETYNSKQ